MRTFTYIRLDVRSSERLLVPGSMPVPCVRVCVCVCLRQEQTGTEKLGVSVDEKSGMLVWIEAVLHLQHTSEA